MKQVEVLAVNISKKKGTIKVPADRIMLDANGVSGDAHAGPWHRQVSLLGQESIEKSSKAAKREIEYGEFAENITTKGVELFKTNPLDRLWNDSVELEITQIGKKCHGDTCAIFKEVGDCVMPKEGIFARVVKGGELKAGDVLNYKPKVYKCRIVTMSDRASQGVYRDKSGPLLDKMLKAHYDSNNKELVTTVSVIPDDADQLSAMLEDARESEIDLFFTTGGTGIGSRDITPDVVLRHLDKEIPGIMELVRLKYGMDKPAAVLSRSVAGVMGKTLVFAIPGSPKAVNEYITEIVKILDHAFLMLAGIDGH